MQQDQLGKSFGLIIGFLIPGMVGLYGVSLHVEMIEGWFSVASTAPSSSVGGFLFVLVTSIGVGVFISNVRWLVLEKWIWKREPPEHDASARKGTQTELVYQNLVWQFYHFYLFAANTMFALGLLYLAWLAAEIRAAGLVVDALRLGAPLLLLAPACYVLYKSGRNSLDRYTSRRSNVLQMPPQGRTRSQNE